VSLSPNERQGDKKRKKTKREEWIMNFLSVLKGARERLIMI
jgi:hypothetical protein